MQSSNPAISAMRNAAGVYNFGGVEAGATISGTTTKSILLVGLTMVVGYLAMNYTLAQIYSGQGISSLLMYGSIFGALIVAFITIFKPNVAPITAPIYAVLEGGALGTLSGVFEFQSTLILVTFAPLLFDVVTIPELLPLLLNWIESFPPADWPAYDTPEVPFAVQSS